MSQLDLFGKIDGVAPFEEFRENCGSLEWYKSKGAVMRLSSSGELEPNSWICSFDAIFLLKEEILLLCARYYTRVGAVPMPFDIYVCKKFCPYLKGRFPSFGISWSSDGTCFAPKNGEGCGQCVVTREEAPFSLPKGKIRKWMTENVDVEHDLRNCPCYAEHLLSEYAHKK